MFQSRTALTDDAVVISSVPEEDDEENICQLPPVTPHLRACLAYMPKWTFDSRYTFEKKGRCRSFLLNRLTNYLLSIILGKRNAF